MRQSVVRLHRYAGLSLAGFLLLSALTGSVLAFYDEIDRALNPAWFKASAGAPRPLDVIVAAVEARYPAGYVSRITLPPSRGESLRLWLAPRPSPKPVPLDVNQLFVDPTSGAVLGARYWGAWRFDRAHAVPFIYELHHRLHLGQWGSWLLGGVALLWALDCLIGLYLAWPRPQWRAIKRAFAVKNGAGVARRHYDLHRAGGLWLWPVLFVLAVSGLYLNVPEWFRPALAWLTPVTDAPRDTRVIPGDARPTLGWDTAVVRARAALGPADARTENASGAGMNDAAPGDIRFQPAAGVYRVGFHTANDIAADLPGVLIYVSAADGAILGRQDPRAGGAGDTILQWLFPLHSGRAFGVPGRAIIALSGVVTIVLVVTGIAIWRRKRAGAVVHCSR